MKDEFLLNASLWGNDYEGVVTYEPFGRPAVSYLIGPIAHDGYAGVEGVQLFQQRAFLTPSNIFKQVKFILEPGRELKTIVREVASMRLHSWRYVRAAPRTWQ